MKILVMELGDKEKKDSVFLKEKDGRIALIVKYNLEELLKKVTTNDKTDKD